MTVDAAVRAACLADVAAGHSLREVGRRHGVSARSVQKWGDAAALTEYAAARLPRDYGEREAAIKKVGATDWRAWARWAEDGQSLRAEGSWSNRTARIDIPADGPILVVPISDFHWGSWGADYREIVRFTDELMAVLNLYIALLGDLEQQAIKMRGVLEMSDNLLPPETQSQFTESWLDEVGDRILFSTWDNHAVVRQEDATGGSAYATTMKRRFTYFSGIGHVDLHVGDECYRLAVSHKFRGSSVNDPCAAQKNYLLREGRDREIAIQGDTHRPGRASYYTGGARKLAINCGTLQTDSGYAARYFSLFTVPVFPCFELWPDAHCINDFESLWHWKRATRHGG